MPNLKLVHATTMTDMVVDLKLLERAIIDLYGMALNVHDKYPNAGLNGSVLQSLDGAVQLIEEIVQDAEG